MEQGRLSQVPGTGRPADGRVGRRRGWDVAVPRGGTKRRRQVRPMGRRRVHRSGRRRGRIRRCHVAVLGPIRRSPLSGDGGDQVQARQGPRRARPRRRRERRRPGVRRRSRRPTRGGGQVDGRRARECRPREGAGRRVAARVLVHLRGRTTGFAGVHGRAGAGRAGRDPRRGVPAPERGGEDVRQRRVPAVAHPGRLRRRVAGTLVRGGRARDDNIVHGGDGGVQPVRRRAVQVAVASGRPAEGGEGRAHERRRAFGKLRDDVRG
mmetsp:Transcript_15251/g.59635  ORF Transcript_15251/g.59635 Transcript_15251/m.59635 type:complete len:265 (-) Transcript_15251:111-905(-)